MLLLLDNFEHVVAAGPSISELLAGGPDLKVLITSRAVLKLRGEFEYVVLPLAVPSVERPVSLDEAMRSAAVRLFVERAKATNPRFELTEDNAPAVAEICARLDGLPLALELAAARTKLLPPQAMLARLANRLQLLTGGPRPARTAADAARHPRLGLRTPVGGRAEGVQDPRRLRRRIHVGRGRRSADRIALRSGRAGQRRVTGREEPSATGSRDRSRAPFHDAEDDPRVCDREARRERRGIRSTRPPRALLPRTSGGSSTEPEGPGAGRVARCTRIRA